MFINPLENNEMEKTIQSKALEINLEQTRKLHIIIPDEHEWFIRLSGSYFGINDRTKDFFNELHHPYSNRSIVVKQLPNLIVGDFWFYQENAEAPRAFGIILQIIESLLKENLPAELSNQVVYTFLKFLEDLSKKAEANQKAIDFALDLIEKNHKTQTFSFINNLGFSFKSLNILASDPVFSARILGLTREIIRENLDFWQSTTNIEAWYSSNEKIFRKEYRSKINQIGPGFFDAQYKMTDDASGWEELVQRTYTFADIASRFRKFTDEFETSIEKFHYIFYLLHLPGMDNQRDNLLWDLNKVIKNMSQELNEEQIIASIDDLFMLFDEFKKNYVGTVLDSVLTLGKEIMNTSNLTLIHYFENKVIRLGFTSPGLAYVTDNWQVRVDRNHIKNIRVYLELIEYGPEIMKRLLSSLIINLHLGGIFIFDNDLFQRDITQLLNSKISPLYKQIKQLTRIFPVYFNEIGAEGELRDITTSLDEITQRNDKLIHFLRKQIHTEGNNAHINITLQILNFWKTRHLEYLIPHVPSDLLNSIDLEGPWVTGVHDVVNEMCETSGLTVSELSELDTQQLDQLSSKISEGRDKDKQRVLLIIKLYQLLKEKYSFETGNICTFLSHYIFFNQEEIRKLTEYLETHQDEEALLVIYGFMARLNQIIFDPAKSQGWENIYHKRHIAFGIPSMYGEYHETKFEALGVTFRLEQIATMLMERIIRNRPTDYITAQTLKNIYSILKLIKEGLELDGISDQGLNSNLQMLQYSLTSGSFTVKQYINIFQFMEDSVKEIINHYFIRPYDDLLKIIIPEVFPGEAGSNEKSVNQFISKKSEAFYRDLLASAFLIQHLDNFLGKVLNNLRKMVDDFSTEDIRSIMSYDPDVIFSPFFNPTPAIDSQIFLGSKGYYLKKLFLADYPIPPGFILTTEIFRRKNSILKQPSLNAEIDTKIKNNIAELERLTHREFGNPLNPLLLSVRSGSAISMPGAMNTFLNVGLNDEITEKLSKQHNFGWTSWDCYRRLLQTWGMSFGIDRNIFDQIILDYKKRYEITRKIDFSPAVMKEIAFSYKEQLADNHIYFEQDPFLQVKQAVISVFSSWDTPRTNVYRNHMQIADEWGTAVIIQKMVFGNIHRESGSGVLFTHDPHETTPDINLTGDFSFLSQGEDIVAGLVNTLPISKNQRLKYFSESTISLEEAFPKIFDRLKELSVDLIEKHGFGHLEIEFTFETPEEKDLYILQIRDMSITKQKQRLFFTTPQKKMKQVGRGIGIGNEVMNGLLAFDMDDIRMIQTNHPDDKCILVRPDTVPDDIELIFECDGLITGKGGATSHAAVTAARLRKVCIVNCTDLIMDERNKTCRIGNEIFSPFDKIAIDSALGIIYKGNYPTRIQEL